MPGLRLAGLAALSAVLAGFVGPVPRAAAQTAPFCQLTATAPGGQTQSVDTGSSTSFVVVPVSGTGNVTLAMSCSGLLRGTIDWIDGQRLTSGIVPIGENCRAAVGFAVVSSGPSLTVSATPGAHYFAVAVDADGNCAEALGALLQPIAPISGIAIVAGNNQLAAPGQRLPQDLVVSVVNANGSPDPQAQLTGSLDSGPGLVTTGTLGQPAPGAVPGQFRIPFVMGSEPGARRIRICVGSTRDCVVFDARTTATSGVSVVAGDGQVGVPGQTLPSGLVVEIRDASGAALPGVTVTWALVQGSGTIAPFSSVTDAQGRASTTFTLGSGAGLRVVRASAAGTSVDFTIGSVADVVVASVQQTVAAQAQVAISAPVTQLANVRARLDGLRMARKSDASLRGLRVSVDGRALPLSAIAASLAPGKGEREAGDRPAGGGASADGFERWGVFAQGDLELGRQAEVDGVGGFKLRTKGLTLGTDYRFDGNHVLGVSLGLLRSDTTLANDAGDQDVKGYSLSLYGAWMLGDSGYLNLIGNAGRNDYDGRRRLAASAGYAGSSTSGDQYGLSVSGGYDFVLGALTLTPFGRVEYVRATIDGFAESDAGAEALELGAQRVSATYLAVGGQAWWAISTAWGVLQPNLRIDWQKQTAGSDRTVTARLVSAVDGTLASVPVVTQDRDFGSAAIGVQWLMPMGVQAFFNYERQFGRSNFEDERFLVGVRGRF